MHYILDGYNIIHKTPAFEKLLAKSLQTAREGLIRFCTKLLQARGDIEKITIIFDGKSDLFSDQSASGKVEIIFTFDGEEADDRIVQYLRETQPRFAAIVSDDNYVGNSARAFKVKSISVADFLKPYSGKKTSQTKRVSAKDSSGKKLSSQQSRDITQAYAEYLGIE